MVDQGHNVASSLEMAEGAVIVGDAVGSHFQAPTPQLPDGAWRWRWLPATTTHAVGQHPSEECADDVIVRGHRMVCLANVVGCDLREQGADVLRDRW